MVVGADEIRRSSAGEAAWIKIDPERDRVRVRCGGRLDAGTAAQLTRDCEGLIDRGFRWLLLDIRHTTSIAPAAVSAIAVLDHRARAGGCRLSVVPGSGGAAATLRRAGLLGRLHLEGSTQLFWDWSH